MWNPLDFNAQIVPSTWWWLTTPWPNWLAPAENPPSAPTFSHAAWRPRRGTRARPTKPRRRRKRWRPTLAGRWGQQNTWEVPQMEKRPEKWMVLNGKWGKMRKHTRYVMFIDFFESASALCGDEIVELTNGHSRTDTTVFLGCCFAL